MIGSLKELDVCGKFTDLPFPDADGVGVNDGIGIDLETTNSPKLERRVSRF